MNPNARSLTSANSSLFQEEPTSKDTDEDVSILREDDTKTTASWRKNNAEVINPETNNRVVNSHTIVDTDVPQKDKDEKEAETTWKDHQDNILEDQRKNSKNEINAKLNNQEHNLETERKDDKDRKVRRIDLKAYGFENSFSDQKRTATRQQRMVNRLDLSSFGYQDGVLRRACSNNQLDQPLRNNEKSNLTRSVMEHRVYKRYVADAPKSLDCKDFAKSSKDLNKLQDKVEEVGPRLISAKSMPNVTDDVYYKANPVHVNENQDQNQLAAKNLLDRVIDKSKEEEATNERDAIVEDDGSLLNGYKTSPEMDRSFENIYVKNKDHIREASKELHVLPSVKRLAEAFGKRHTSEIETATPAKVNRASVAKVDDAMDRSSTPEVQIIETPRQMHSLTARSLSREFREGLRQMPGKVTSPPVSRSLIEERSPNHTEIVRSKQEDNDITVISRGKLKSNIIFWEQMQKKS